MKKLLSLFFVLTVLAACGSDDPDPNPPVNPPVTEWDGDWNDSKDPHWEEYKGNYNPIKGEWIVVKKNGMAFTDFLVYKFDTFHEFSTANKKPAEATDPTFKVVDSYKINGTAYKVKDTIYKYKLGNNSESLEITDGTTTLVLQPYESGAWKWKGDWNNPNDPHYAIYNGKYNPIVGTWKLTHIGGDKVLPSNADYFRFNEDFTIEESSHFAGTYRNKRKYWINDIGVKEDAFETHISYTLSYRIEGDTLHYRTMLPKPSIGMTFVRFK